MSTAPSLSSAAPSADRNQASSDDPPPPPEDEDAPPPPKELAIHKRLRDGAGPVPGLESRTLKRRPDPGVCGGVGVSAIWKRDPTADEAPLATMYELAFPSGLSFSANKRAEWTKRFDTWLAEARKVAKFASDFYAKQMTRADAAGKSAAMARAAQVQFRLAAVIARGEIAADIAVSDTTGKLTTAYCNKLAKLAEPIVKEAEKRAASCAAKAKGPTGWWSAVCR